MIENATRWEVKGIWGTAEVTGTARGVKWTGVQALHGSRLLATVVRVFQLRTDALPELRWGYAPDVVEEAARECAERYGGEATRLHQEISDQGAVH